MNRSLSEDTNYISILPGINELKRKQSEQDIGFVGQEEKTESDSLMDNSPETVLEPIPCCPSKCPLIEYVFSEKPFTLFQQSGLSITEVFLRLDALYTNFTLQAQDGLTHTEEEFCFKLNLSESFLNNWFKLIRALEHIYELIDRHTLFMTIISKGHTFKGDTELFIPTSKPLKLSGITALIVNVFNLSSSEENADYIQNKSCASNILGIESAILDDWFSHFKMILNLSPGADISTFAKLLISQTKAANTRCYIPISQLEPHSLWDKCYQENASNLLPEKRHGSGKKLDFDILQTNVCQSKFDHKDRCCACISKNGDSCRFRYLRLLAKKNGKYIVRNRFLTAINAQEVMKNTKFEKHVIRNFKISLKSRLYKESFKATKLTPAPSQICDYDAVDRSHYARYTMGFLAPALLPILKRELDHVSSEEHEPHYRKPTSPIGQTCDSCNTNIFSAFWICTTCGKEICVNCHSNWDSEKLLHRNYLENCRGTSIHKSSNFIPVTSYFPSIIKSLYDSVSAYIEAHPSGPEKLPPICPESLYTPKCYPSLPYPYMEPEEFTIDHFRSCWQNGQPAVLKGSRITPKYPVTPSHFTKHYGDVEAEILKPDGKGFRKMTIKDFFSEFDNPEKSKQDMKIKDWPSEGSYQECFPHLNRDFMNMLPFPEYMAYTGPLNLVSTLPSHSHKIPDLGPKTYIAYAGSQGEVVGTTQLHLDAADAINVLQYSGGNPDEPGAVWDLFRREDTELIRQFIWEKHGDMYNISDPIHDQAFYLSDDLLEELHFTKNVRSYRVYQRVGEVVLIPAGCPHQVRNLHPCIKTAMDFVAPEGLTMCTKLAAEFRVLSRRHKRGVDIVGTATLLAQAWGTCLKWTGTGSPFLDEHIMLQDPSKPKNKRSRDTEEYVHTSKKSKQKA